MSAPVMDVTWSPALAPATRPFYDEEPEPLPCPSVWFIRAERDRPAFQLGCDMDAGHPGDSVDGRHGNGLARWTTETAETSRVEYLASLGPLCTECRSRPQHIGGRCWICAGVEIARDNYETESEAA